jgi:chloramphenicol O-acetyltransferase
MLPTPYNTITPRDVLNLILLENITHFTMTYRDGKLIYLDLNCVEYELAHVDDSEMENVVKAILTLQRNRV